MAESKTTAASKPRRSSRIIHDEKRIEALRDRGSYLGVSVERDEDGNVIAYKSGSTLKFSGRTGMWSGRAGRARRPEFIYVESVRLAGIPEDIEGYLKAAGYSDEDIANILNDDENVFVMNDPRENDPAVIRKFTGGSAAPGAQESASFTPEQELLAFAEALIPERYNATQVGAGAGVASPRTRQSLIDRVRNRDTNLVVSKIDEEGKGVTSRKNLPVGGRTQLRAHPDLPNVYSDNAAAYSTAMEILADQDLANADLYQRLSEEFPRAGLSPAEILGGGVRASPRPAAPVRGTRGIGSQVRTASRPATVRRSAGAGPPAEAKEEVTPAPSAVPRPQTGPRTTFSVRGRGGGRGGRGGTTFIRRNEGRPGSPGRQ